MPASPDRSSQAVRELFLDRFGVDPAYFDSLHWAEVKEEVWVGSLPPPPGVAHSRPPGLRAARIHPKGIKPTSHFLALLGRRITRARAAVELEELRQLLLGQRIRWPNPEAIADGFMAICYREDVIGCGVLRGERLHALIPTGRRRELLNILDNAAIR